MLLAIDTSTAHTGLACYDARGLVAECVWHSGRDHTAQLLPQLTMLLRHTGRSREEISAVAVALGPGSWSGLRVGLSTAKGFALARDLPILGIGTLDVLAYQQARPGMPVYPLIRLGRERYAVAAYGVGDAERRAAKPRNTTLLELCAEIGGQALFCGDIDGDVQEVLRGQLGDRARFPTPAANQRRPGFLAELAWRRLQAGDVDDVATLEPIYLGQPVKTVA
ncbi:MAG: tRNA (adenosine(37)-N6)-threonylcarbamoyltransferase complex dimerization subunit type 1 TsaB [Chloroflexota bacterium]